MRTKPTLAGKITSRQRNLSRNDIADWSNAIRRTLQSQPKYDKLQEIYTDIMRDAFLSSQIAVRRNKILSAPFSLSLGDKDMDIEDNLRRLVRSAIGYCSDSLFYGYSYLEFTYNDMSLTLLDRRNFDPQNRLIYFDLAAEGIPVDRLREYGTTLLEFNSGSDGLLLQAAPHVLFKRYAQSCWSELCEIYGMPPRYIKTNSQDQELVERYRQMLADIGSGASYILDLDDEMGFASTNATDGSVYERLIHLCSNEISLLVNGAVIGQDTVNGSNAKEQASQAITNDIIQGDKTYIEDAMNTVLIPALASFSIIPQDALFSFPHQEDSAELFSQTIQAANYFDIDTEWFREKFGIEVTASKTNELSARNKDFFA